MYNVENVAKALYFSAHEKVSIVLAIPLFTMGRLTLQQRKFVIHHPANVVWTLGKSLKGPLALLRLKKS